MSTSKLVACYARIALHVLIALSKLAYCFHFWSTARRQHEIRNWSKKALSIFGITLRVSGSPPPQAAALLLVANHISWLDILIIQTQFDVVFVAKEEVRTWLAFGWIAKRLDTIFVSRRQSQQIGSHAATLTKQLIAGTTVCVFPEGTSSDGTGVLPFKSAMFQPAIDAAVSVLPLAIRYVDDDGRRADTTAFVGDMSLLQSFQALARATSVRAELQILPAVATAQRMRRDIASRAEATTRLALLSSGGAPVLLSEAA
jgi:1-acyl-sn-glycerol-3-phosphate acyltransferase